MGALLCRWRRRRDYPKQAHRLFCPRRASRLWRSVPNASRLVEPDGSHPIFTAQMKTPPFRGRLRLDGGEGGIRTLDTLLTYTPLAGERLQPLGHFS